MSIKIVILIIWMHFIIDFMFQSRNSAKTKHKDNKVLLGHCVIYSLPFFYFGWLYAIMNGILHFGVDYTTSRLTAAAVHKYGFSSWPQICILGADQALHLTSLFLTYYLLFIK